MEVQDVIQHQGVTGNDSVVILQLKRKMLQCSCMNPHVCEGDKDCNTCDLTTTFFQLSMDILSHLCPEKALQNNKVILLIDFYSYT